MKLFTFNLSIFFVLNLNSQLLISQYIETSSGTTPKGIEIFNYSSSPIVFSNSNNLQISQGTNGATCNLISATNITSGTLAAGKVWVIGTSDLITYVNANALDLAGTTSYSFTFNGDDALTLSLGGVVKDVFGTCGNDPGSSWSGNGVSTENQNIQLLSTIAAGTTSYWSNPSLRYETVSTTNQMTGFGNAPFSSLPVELVSFSAICEDNNTVSVNWTTASEHNSNYYSVEKSRDGLNWNILTTKTAAGNSTQLINYSVSDVADISGTIYYRLTQVDLDAASKVYDIVSTNCLMDQQLSFLAYPNPSIGQFTVKIENAVGGKYAIAIADIQGKAIEQQTIDLETGTTVVKMNPLGLQPGMYLLQFIQNGNVLQQQKVLIE